MSCHVMSCRVMPGCNGPVRSRLPGRTQYAEVCKLQGQARERRRSSAMLQRVHGDWLRERVIRFERTHRCVERGGVVEQASRRRVVQGLRGLCLRAPDGPPSLRRQANTVAVASATLSRKQTPAAAARCSCANSASLSDKGALARSKQTGQPSESSITAS